MFRWAFIFLILATINAVYGYRKPRNTYKYIAKLLFFTFLFIFFAILIAELFSTTSPHTEPPPSGTI